MSKTHAPGPYEVVMVEDAQGKNGEKWIMIRNEGGAIATVYPAKEGEATAKLLAAAPELLEACIFVSASNSLICASPEYQRLAAVIAKAEGRPPLGTEGL